MNVLNVKNKKTVLILLGVLIIFITVVVNQKNVFNRNNSPSNIIEGNLKQNHVLKIGKTSIYVDIADTPVLREHGLSGREALSGDRGMYFIFDRSDFYQFWMKDMNFPIDIIWIDETMSVVDITLNVLPSSFPKTFTSRAPARYVLEVPAGFSERAGIKIGDQVEIMTP